MATPHEPPFRGAWLYAEGTWRWADHWTLQAWTELALIRGQVVILIPEAAGRPGDRGAAPQTTPFS